MPYLIIRHKVEDYVKWKPVFDEHATARRQAGSKGIRVLRSAENPNEVLAISEWETLDQARAFAGDPGLRETMQRAGIADRPDLYFVNEVDAQPA
jgi:heme-degrading monooxygenase HmoA